MLKSSTENGNKKQCNKEVVIAANKVFVVKDDTSRVL